MKRIISGLCAVMSVIALLSFSGCEEPVDTTDSSSLRAHIIVDEETLVQYIFYGDFSYLADGRVASLTVRLKEDGTPCTIEREDLDKYPHFTFSKKENE